MVPVFSNPSPGLLEMSWTNTEIMSWADEWKEWMSANWMNQHMKGQVQIFPSLS